MASIRPSFRSEGHRPRRAHLQAGGRGWGRVRRWGDTFVKDPPRTRRLPGGPRAPLGHVKGSVMVQQAPPGGPATSQAGRGAEAATREGRCRGGQALPVQPEPVPCPSPWTSSPPDVSPMSLRQQTRSLFLYLSLHHARGSGCWAELGLWGAGSQPQPRLTPRTHMAGGVKFQLMSGDLVLGCPCGARVLTRVLKCGRGRPCKSSQIHRHRHAQK